MLRRELLGGCGAVVTALAGCVSMSGSLDAEETITREYDGIDVSQVETETVNGDLEIRDENRETVRVDGRKEAADEEALDEISLEADHDGEVLSLIADHGDDGLLSFGPSSRMELSVTIPESLAVTAETTNGDLSVSGLDAGSLDVDSSTETTIGAGTHRIAVETTNGDLTIQGDA